MNGTFSGANIKGNPKMKSTFVSHDVKLLMARSDVFAVQEFMWRTYWSVVAALMGIKWSSYPGKVVGLANPNKGAQAIFWKRSVFKKLQTYCKPAFDFNLDNAGIMPNRWVRGILLQARKGMFTAWFLSTHFVVGGDSAGDGPKRKNFMLQNIDALDKALDFMSRTGFPIMGEIDANIHKGSWAYGHLMDVLKKHHAVIHGDHGVEFAFTIPGLHGSFLNVDPNVIPTSQLYTDHEARVLSWRGHYIH